MTVGYAEPLFILAFDHRTSFERKLFGVTEYPSEEQCKQMRDAKQLILSGLLAAGDQVPRPSIGALVDEHYGAGAVRRARAEGLLVAICAERSSQIEFDFEYGEEFGHHIAALEPDFVKVLARYNIEGDPGANRRQAARLAHLSAWLESRESRFLFELIVPPEPHQSVATDEDPRHFAAELRPALAAAAIRELQDAGVEPDVWKVEGLETEAAGRLIVAAARAGGRRGVGCVVLGAGASPEKVAHWLRNAASVTGFTGFAIGRTIWWEAVNQWRLGTISDDAAIHEIAENYTRTVQVYLDAQHSTEGRPDPTR